MEAIDGMVTSEFGDVRVVVTDFAVTIWERNALPGSDSRESVVLTHAEAAFVRDQITAALAAGLVRP